MYYSAYEDLWRVRLGSLEALEMLEAMCHVMLYTLKAAEHEL